MQLWEFFHQLRLIFFFFCSKDLLLLVFFCYTWSAFFSISWFNVHEMPFQEHKNTHTNGTSRSMKKGNVSRYGLQIRKWIVACHEYVEQFEARENMPVLITIMLWPSLKLPKSIFNCLELVKTSNNNKQASILTDRLFNRSNINLHYRNFS